MMKPIDVILPVYNGMPYLQQSVESVLAQSFMDFEFWILDDCSEDGSWEYLSGLKDPRITLLRNDVNRGLFPNLNILIRSSGSPLVKLWAQDDIMYPKYLETTISFHSRYPGIGFSYTGRDYIDEAGRVQPSSLQDHTPELVSTELHSRIAFFTGSIAGNIANVTLSRAALDKVGLFREDMRISGDFDMWVRLARYFPVGFICQPLIQLRDHSGQLSRQKKYYLFHLKEDIQVYNYLLSYVPDTSRKEGRILLRNYKLMFYYTLMVKALFKGRCRTAAAFFYNLARFDNMLKLTYAFIIQKLVRKDRFHSRFLNNDDLVTVKL